MELTQSNPPTMPCSGCTPCNVQKLQTARPVCSAAHLSLVAVREPRALGAALQVVAVGA